MADFFEEIDSMGVVERHLKALLQLEESEANKVLRQYKEIRQELRDRLDRLPSGIFTAQKLRGVLVQVETAIELMQKGLLNELDDASYKAALRGVEDTITEIKRFEKHFTGAVQVIPLNVVRIAQDSNELLMNRYQASIQAYSQDIRSTITRELTMATIQQKTSDEMVRKLGAWWQAEEWKLRRIARTELHNAYNVSKINGMIETQEEYLPDLKKTLYHPMDHRTADDSRYLANKNLIVDIDKPFKYKWNGVERVFMAPPSRPNDRAVLIPYRKVWTKD